MLDAQDSIFTNVSVGWISTVDHLGAGQAALSISLVRSHDSWTSYIVSGFPYTKHFKRKRWKCNISQKSGSVISATSIGDS